MGRLSNISGKEAVRIFEKFGYVLDRQTGNDTLV
ncbi:type II toxin-antitoxin system HicA family toxin [Nostoc sp.]